MDAYAFIETDAATEDGMLAFISVATEGELLELQQIIARRRAEVCIPTGQLVGLTTEGENHVSPWKVVRPTSPPSGAVIDVVTAGSFPTLCLSEEAWEQGHSMDAEGERLSVAVNASHGYLLRPLEDDDPEVGPEV